MEARVDRCLDASRRGQAAEHVSDHNPIMMRIPVQRRTVQRRAPCIPKWVCDHKHFRATLLAKIPEKSLQWQATPFDKLHFIIQHIHETARLTKEHARMQGTGDVHHEFYWAQRLEQAVLSSARQHKVPNILRRLPSWAGEVTTDDGEVFRFRDYPAF